MKIREDILNELNAISSAVAAVPNVNVFTINRNYFAGIEIELKAKIVADTMTGLQNNAAVPTGYFENLPSIILQKIKQAENEVFAETMEQSALIAGIGNSNVFTTPKYYFEQIAFVNQQKPAANVIQMNRSRGVFKYIAAAVITGLLGLSIVNIVSKRETVPTYNMINQTSEAMNSADIILKTGTFETALAAVSDNDIEHYLQQGGQDVNAALVAASTDETDKLPEASEYLLDDNALKNYLKENNLKK